MTNFNMDGCMCEILLKQIYDFDEVLRAGYGKLKIYHKENKFTENKYGQGFEKLIFTSIQLPGNLFEDMADHYGEQLSVVDHHPDTEMMLTGNNGARVTWNPKQASCMSIYEAIHDVGKVDISQFKALVDFVNKFEMWDTESKEWGVAYAMNALFWHYNYFKFLERYENGVSKSNPIITPEERSIIEGIFKDKQTKIKGALKEEFDNSVIFMNAEAEVVSDFALQKEYSHYETYFIIYNNYQGKQTIAVRVNGKYQAQMTAGEAVIKATAGRNDVFGAGFGNVASIAVHQEKNLDGLLDIIEMVHRYLTRPVISDIGGGIGDDVPF